MRLFLTEDPKGGRVIGALEPAILKASSPGAQTIPMVLFSNFERLSPVEPWKGSNGALEHSDFALRSPDPIKICSGDSELDIP